MPDRPRKTMAPTASCWCALLLLLLASPVTASAQHDEPTAADGPAAAPIDADPGFTEPPETGFTRYLPDDPPRALRHVAGGVELYEPATNTALRRFLPEKDVTAWAYARGDRWWVALAGGEVVEVDFDAKSVSPAMRFDGDVHWLGLERDGLNTRVRLAVAEHTVEGLGRFMLLYTTGPEEGVTVATTLDMDFVRVYEDDYRRAWLLPQPGARLSSLHYVDLETSAVTAVDVPREAQSPWKRYGGVLSVPDGPLLVWGFTEGDRGPQISWVAELAPPIFDDAAWQEVVTFRTVGLPLARESDRLLAARIQRGAVSLSYQADFEMLHFRDEAADIGWVALPTMGAWVDDGEWPSLYLRGHDALPEELVGIQLGAVLQDAAEPLPEPLGPPETYLDQLLAEPAQRAGHLDPEREMDRLLGAMLVDVRWQGLGRGPGRFSRERHVSAESGDGMLLGLSDGLIVALAPGTGRLESVAQINGIPYSIDRREHEGAEQLVIEYWRFWGWEDIPRRVVMERLVDTDWWHEVSDEEAEDKQPAIWTDRRVAQLKQFGHRWSMVEWLDLPSDREFLTIERDDALNLSGLLELPDGRVLGYGEDLVDEDNGPVLVDVTRGRDGIVWSREMGHLCEQAPLPEGGFTHAAYIPAAGRLLLVADGKVWSTGLGFRDWRRELPALPERAVDAAGDVE